MGTDRRDTCLLAVALAVLFGLAGWFRVSSLSMGPDPIGDEGCVGTQGVHLLQGEKVTVLSPTRNIINPLLVAMQLPLHVLLPPSFTALRAPAALSGILAVVLAYVLGARILDRTTALIAAALLAVLPIAIIYSRIGWESCQVPLFGVLILYFASRAHRGGLLLAFAASFLAHPTTVFLAPLFLGVLLFQMVKLPPEDPRRRWRSVLATLAVAVVIVGTLAYLKHNSDSTRSVCRGEPFAKGTWSLFLTRYERLLLGFCHGVPTETSPRLDRCFWGIVLGVFALGSWRLVRERRWDRAVLVAGFLATAAGFYLVAGPEGLNPRVSRYGLFLVVPTAFAFACLLRGLLVAPSTPGRAALLRVEVAALLAVGLALVLSFRPNYFEHFAHRPGAPPESIWTLRTESPRPFARITSVITTDLALAGPGRPGRALVITEDWWTYRPVQYLAVWRRDIEVSCVGRVGPAAKQRILRRHLEAGAYAVGPIGQDVDTIVKASFPPEALRRWDIQYGSTPLYVVYRLSRRVGETAGRRPCESPLVCGDDSRGVRASARGRNLRMSVSGGRQPPDRLAIGERGASAP